MENVDAEQQLGEGTLLCKNLLHPCWEGGHDRLISLYFLSPNWFCHLGLSHSFICEVNSGRLHATPCHTDAVAKSHGDKHQESWRNDDLGTERVLTWEPVFKMTGSARSTLPAGSQMTGHVWILKYTTEVYCSLKQHLPMVGVIYDFEIRKHCIFSNAWKNVTNTIIVCPLIRSLQRDKFFMNNERHLVCF